MEDRVRRKIIVYIATSASRHRAHHCESHIQKTRSRRPTRGRLERRREQGELLSQRQVLKNEVGAGLQRSAQSAQQSEYEGHCYAGSLDRRPTSSVRPIFWPTTGHRVSREGRTHPRRSRGSESGRPGHRAARSPAARGPDQHCRPGDHSPAAAIPGSLPEART